VLNKHFLKLCDMLKLLDYLNGMLLNVAQSMIPACMECMHVLLQMIAVHRNQDSIVHNSDRAHHRAHQMEAVPLFLRNIAIYYKNVSGRVLHCRLCALASLDDSSDIHSTEQEPGSLLSSCHWKDVNEKVTRALLWTCSALQHS
jgi:hypothetical protein